MAKNPEQKISSATPFSNVTVWLVSLVFWPITWWLLAYANLKTLWKKYLWAFAFFIGIAMTTLISYFISWEDSQYYSQVTIYILLLNPLIFVLMQMRPINNWSKNNKNRNFNSKRKVFLLGIIWLVLLFLVLLLGHIYFRKMAWIPILRTQLLSLR